MPQNRGKIATLPGGPVSRAAVPGRESIDRPGFLKRVQEILGVRTLRSERDLVALVEQRLPTGTVDALCESGLNDDELHAIVIPRRTLAHRRARGEPLSRNESDRLVRVARIVGLGEQVFGDPERNWRWLRRSKRQLQGRHPLELLTTEIGAKLVEEMLYRIDEGMAA